ncbi:DUF2782 domain-containing protein [Halomonas caseinilytica]|uniref:DUF2782 domain-containing protein n=1 Tax=Halomonas caseinilytica TaxID=438744 RepID=A0A1M6YMU2_9GAMM|nr:DUF2782 domain-containing protein [Halomonas caseinilytica]SHL19614.1 Protein of unknown function [Halomonas caseinilytica]
MLSLFRPFAALLVGGGLLLAGLPALAQSGDSPDPEITTRQEADRTIREYRVDGVLYAIEIQPASGPSYYLVDRDGDGNFERQEGNDITVPEWVRQDG